MIAERQNVVTLEQQRLVDIQNHQKAIHFWRGHNFLKFGDVHFAIVEGVLVVILMQVLVLTFTPTLNAFKRLVNCRVATEKKQEAFKKD